MNKWYCPHCREFRKYARALYPSGDIVYMRYVCRRCGTDMLNAKEELAWRDERYIREYGENWYDIERIGD